MVLLDGVLKVPYNEGMSNKTKTTKRNQLITDGHTEGAFEVSDPSVYPLAELASALEADGHELDPDWTENDLRDYAKLMVDQGSFTLPFIEVAVFTPTEIAYRVPGRTWKRRTFKTAKAMDHFLVKLEDEAAEFRTRAL